jgi:hypothetical protein
MLNIETIVRLYGAASFQILTDNVIKMELKGSCGGGSISLYTTDLNLMYYAIRYSGRGMNMFMRGITGKTIFI